MERNTRSFHDWQRQWFFFSLHYHSSNVSLKVAHPLPNIDSCGWKFACPLKLGQSACLSNCSVCLQKLTLLLPSMSLKINLVITTEQLYCAMTRSFAIGNSKTFTIGHFQSSKLNGPLLEYATWQQQCHGQRTCLSQPGRWLAKHLQQI